MCEDSSRYSPVAGLDLCSGVGDRQEPLRVQALVANAIIIPCAGFDYYRAIDDGIPASCKRMKTGLAMPVLGFAGALACGGAMEEQPRRVADDVRCAVIPDCGHFVPEGNRKRCWRCYCLTSGLIALSWAEPS